ncbi:DUF2254 domain-containing protein [Massilia forsythiae]|uniref:DUF2254 domain-containing protein n=1 Tax=Massilia forsythiae TaxID=2728020 RepID=A0A7Z2W038_9BURK|nr:DUF2254 domain-containing protein [Massilia forsythiae]QJE02466.1 DUF2254 domain-containing protein [Massilia forsythiae]
MKSRLYKWLADALDAFWPLPAAMVIAGILLAVGMLHLDENGALPGWLDGSSWIYNGGGTGARTLLGTIAASTIGVAGTVFSITIAALSLAAGQMGPRLLRNFTRDRGNQVTLGAFLGTFSYSLMVLRRVRTTEESLFTPHLSLTVCVILAFACVATLVYFVGHMASRINVDTVVELVSDDVHRAVDGIRTVSDQAPRPPDAFWSGATAVKDNRSGYLRHVDAAALADWAAEHGTALRVLRRPGDYVFPGAPIAMMTVPVAGVGALIHAHSVLADNRSGANDVEDALRQLVEVAVRALSPGINDPHTAMSVLDRLGAVLCKLARCELDTGVHLRNGEIALEMPDVNYDRLVGLMLHMIRQNAAGSAAILIRMLDVLAQVAHCETLPDRRVTLIHHVSLVCMDAARTIGNASDLDTVNARAALFHEALQHAAPASAGTDAGSQAAQCSGRTP